MGTSLALTEPPCAYVLGRVGSVTVATPAVVVLVPPEEAEEQPVRVHLDQEGRSIVGYSARTPGEEPSPDATKVFVPGLAQVAHAVTSLLELGGAVRTCESLGRSTPAVPVRVPTSLFDATRAPLESALLTLQLPGQTHDAPGHVLALREGTLVVLPTYRMQDTELASDALEPTLSIELGGEVRKARLLVPRLNPELQPSAFPTIPDKDDPTGNARINTEKKAPPGLHAPRGAPPSVGRNT